MKSVIKGIVGIVILAGIIVAAGYPARPIGGEELPVAAVPTMPVELVIPSIGVAARIEPVGVTDRYVMAVPSAAGDVGWYRFGTRPGDDGSAVLAGHVNWTGGARAVFSDLHLMQIGDTVEVKNNYGAADYFIVRDIKRYGATDDATEVFASDDGATRLNLITCDGPWNALLGTHAMRLVVFTEKI